MEKAREYKKKRGPTFARRPFSEALNAALWLYEHNRERACATRQANISLLGKRFSNAALLYASLLHFGLITKSNNTFSFSPEFRLYASRGDASMLKLLFFKQPVFKNVFADLLGLFNGTRSVSKLELRKLVLAQGIPENNADEFERVFLASAETANLLGSGNKSITIRPAESRPSPAEEPLDNGGAIDGEDGPDDFGAANRFPYQTEEELNPEKIRLLSRLLMAREQHDFEILKSLMRQGQKGEDKVNLAIGNVEGDFNWRSRGVQRVSGKGNTANNVQNQETQVDEQKLRQLQEAIDRFADHVSTDYISKAEAAANLQWIKQHVTCSEQPPEALSKVYFVRKLGDEAWNSFRSIVEGFGGSFAAGWLLKMISDLSI